VRDPAVRLANHPFPIQRFMGALTAIVLAWALLAGAQPVRASLGGAGDPSSHHISTGGTACVGAVPSTPERSRVAPAGLAALLFRVDAARRAEPLLERTNALVGGTPPALSRWRLAHATSTSIP